MPAPTITKVGLMSSLCVGFDRALTTSPTGCTCEVSSPATATWTAKPGGSATTESSSGWAKSSRPWIQVLGHVKTGQPPTLPTAARCTWPGDDPPHVPTAGDDLAQRRAIGVAAGRSRPRPGCRSSSGGWCMATMVGVSRLLGQARVEPGQALGAETALDAARIGGVDGDHAQRPAARGVAVVLAGRRRRRASGKAARRLSRSSWLPQSTWTGIVSADEQLADALVLVRDARAR